MLYVYTSIKKRQFCLMGNTIISRIGLLYELTAQMYIACVYAYVRTGAYKRSVESWFCIYLQI